MVVKASMLLVVHVVCVPLLSSSRYLWMSSSRLSVVPSGFVMFISAAALPVETSVAALSKLVPGRRIIWLVAPALRMAVTTFWHVAAQRLMSRSCGSFMSSKTIFSSAAYLVASCVHRLTNSSSVGPPCPMMASLKRAKLWMSIMQWAPVSRHACTSWSYFARLVESSVAPTWLLTRNCHEMGSRNMLSGLASEVQCCICPGPSPPLVPRGSCVEPVGHVPVISQPKSPPEMATPMNCTWAAAQAASEAARSVESGDMMLIGSGGMNERLPLRTREREREEERDEIKSW